MKNVTIQTEWNRRQELIEQESFRVMAADIAREMGVPADLWNNDSEFKVAFLLKIANDYCALENKLTA
jgi:hypothetical protein